MFLAESLAWEISIVGLSLTAFTITNILTKSYRHKTDLLLCIWLVLLNMPLVHATLAHLGYVFPALNLYTNPTLNLLHGPALYLYVRMLVSEKTTMKVSELLHLIPITLIYPLFISMSHPAPMVPKPGQGEFDVGPVGEGGVTTFFEPILTHFGLLNALIFFAYSTVTIYALIQHQKNITGVFSQNDNRISLKWIYALPATFVILVLINVVSENTPQLSAQIDPLSLHLLSFMSFSVLLCFFGVKQKPVFYFRQPLLKVMEVVELEIATEKPARDCGAKDKDSSDTEISKESIAQIINDMQTYMIREKPYLDPDFSVYTLAEALSIPRRILSLVLNSGLSKNFYQYVNEFRIEEVKTQLEQSQEKPSTILDIAFQSGFKSKSSFNSLFKQHCKVTPSQYRKKVKKQE